MAGNEYNSASLLFDLVERLRAGEPMSVSIIEKLQGCRPATARDRMDWLERRFSELLVDTRDPRGRPARRLRHPDGSAPRGDLMTLIAGRIAAGALDHLRGSRLHTALTRGLDRQIVDLEDDDHAHFDRAVRTFLRYHRNDVPDARRAIVDDLFDAILNRHAVRFDYVPLLSGRKTYTFAPWLIVDHRGGLYIYGRKLGETSADATDHRRNFRIDGIDDLRMLEAERTAPPPDAPQLLRADLAQSIGFFRVPEEPVDIRLRATGWFATHLRRVPLHRSQSVISETDGGLELTLRARICPELESIIMAAQPDVEVLEPPALARAVRARLERALDRIGSEGSDSDLPDPNRIS